MVGRAIPLFFHCGSLLLPAPRWQRALRGIAARPGYWSMLVFDPQSGVPSHRSGASFLCWRFRHRNSSDHSANLEAASSQFQIEGLPYERPMDHFTLRPAFERRAVASGESSGHLCRRARARSSDAAFLQRSQAMCARVRVLFELVEFRCSGRFGFAQDRIWCSTDACEALPSVVRAWMSEWCPLKQGTESALVALLRCPFSYPIKQSPAAASLTELARTMGMELFMETFDGTIQQPLGVRANPLMRTTRPAPWLHGCSHPSQPRWWGINE
jgi:hypothetical protein